MSNRFQTGFAPSFSLFLAAALLVAATACQKKENSEAPKAPSLPVQEIRLVTAATQDAPRQNELVGTVAAGSSVTIAAKVSGTISELPVTLGSSVRAGQVLVRLSANEINAQVAQAETQVTQAQRNLERTRRLLAKEAATAEEERSQAEGLRLAEAGRDQVKSMLAYTTITAPFSGRVAEKFVNVGSLATPGAPLLTLENSGRLQVVVAVPEGLLAQVKQGGSLPVTIPAANFNGNGTVAEIAPGADAASRSATVKLNISGSGLLPGQFARVTLAGAPTTATAAALTVPATAVVGFGQMEKLFVVENGTAHLRLVRTGETRDGKVEILAGLAPGEQVVSEGAESLQDGQPVRVKP